MSGDPIFKHCGAHTCFCSGACMGMNTGFKHWEIPYNPFQLSPEQVERINRGVKDFQEGRTPDIAILFDDFNTLDEPEYLPFDILESEKPE